LDHRQAGNSPPRIAGESGYSCWMRTIRITPALGRAVAIALALAAPLPALGQSLEPAAPASEMAPADQPAKVAGAWQVQTITIPEAPKHILGAGTLISLDRIVIETLSGAWYTLSDCPDGLCAELINNPKPLDPLPVGALPGSQLATGQHSISRAWLAEPSQRLEGTTLGGPVAAALMVEDNTARLFRLDLPTTDAFEDRRPHLADLGPEHPDTILLVRSNEDTGATLAAIALTGEGLLQSIARTEPSGVPRAWLNPIGAADFTGTGVVDVAIVQSPDNGGELQLLALEGPAFRRRLGIRNVSNHIPGSHIMDMAVIADFDADGTADIAIPDAGRQRIRILSFRDGQAAEPASIALPAAVTTEIAGVSTGAGKRPYLLMGLADGQLILLH
jgi:hypothetical protein